MNSKSLKGALDIWLAESWALDEMDSLIRQKAIVDQEHVKGLSCLRESMAPSYSDTTFSTNRAHFLRQLDDEIRAQNSKHSMVTQLTELESSPKGKHWAEFRNLRTAAEDAKEQYSKALECAKEHLSPAQFWSQVGQAEIWTDLRLPQEDLRLRSSVNLLNSCRAAAFEFYQKRRPELFDYYQKRLGKVCEILGIPSRASICSDVLASSADFSGPFSAEADLERDTLGSFAPVKYVNFLNEGKKGWAIFGSGFASGSGELGRLLLSVNDLGSPPLPIFIEPNPEEGNILECMKRAFRLEELCAERSSVYEALRATIDPSFGVYRVDKGWILAFMLVNHPKPLICLNEEQIHTFRTSLPRDRITVLFQKESEEYAFLKRLWPHTNDLNIQHAASAITQAKGTQRILSDIHSKWDIERDMPAPAHRKWPLEDPGTRRLLGLRRDSSASQSWY